MSDDEGCFACGAVRLEPFGTYTIQAAHEKELGRMREALRAAEKRELEALAELDEARDLLQAVATACRGLGPRTDAVMSVVGNALAELDEQRANVEMLKTHVETLREASQSAAREVMRLRAERDAIAGEASSIEQNVGALLDLYHDRMIESEHQAKLALERAAEKDRAYGEALAERDKLREEFQRLHERLNLSKPASF